MPTEHPDRSDEDLVALSQFLVDEGTVGHTLLRVAELACHAAPADMVGLTLMVEGEVSTGVFTDPATPEIDRQQYTSGRGPCLDAFRRMEVNRIDSTADETRWPEFCLAAAVHGVRSSLSLPMVARHQALGALNLYSRSPAAFDEGSAARLEPFADAAAIVLANAQVYWDARTLSDNLRQAMQSRATIDQAIGILMAPGGRTAADAFELLVRASQRENRKMRDMAAEMVDRAEHRPGPPDAPGPG